MLTSFTRTNRFVPAFDETIPRRTYWAFAPGSIVKPARRNRSVMAVAVAPVGWAIEDASFRPICSCTSMRIPARLRAGAHAPLKAAEDSSRRAVASRSACCSAAANENVCRPGEDCAAGLSGGVEGARFTTVRA